ncbi:MAG: NAD(P)-dependent alcohol dehydrogenase [Candidatus Limnocylindria bacterium]
MKAIVRDRYGSPDVVEVHEVDKPVLGADDVLVRVRASSLNAADLDFVYGRPWAARIGIGLRAPRQRVLGVDVAGEVEAVGGNVTELKPGDAVFGDMYEFGQGAFAEYVSAPARAFAPKPDGMTFEVAATLPHAAILALQGLRGGRSIQAGHRVLVNGASGNVGPFAVQIAKTRGAEVTGVCSTDKMELVRSIGADHVIDYTREDFTRNGQRYDFILDVIARHSIFDYRRSLAPGGRYVCVGGTGGRLLQVLILGALLSLTDSRKLALMVWWKPFKREDVATLVELIEAGQVTPVIDRIFPLSQVPEALRYLDDGHARGKVLITM